MFHYRNIMPRQQNENRRGCNISNKEAGFKIY